MAAEKVQAEELNIESIRPLFLEYFSLRGIDPEKDTIKQTKFKSAFNYIYTILFKADNNKRYNQNSKLNYNDIKLLNRVVDIFIDLCFEFNIVPSKDNFYRLTGITVETLSTWSKGEYRGKVYYDLDGNLIKDIQEWKLNKRGEYKEEATRDYILLTQKISEATKEFYRGNLTDTPVGQITIANNDRDTGLMYAQVQAQVQAEAFGKPQISMADLKQLRDKRRELPRKPELD